MCTRDYLFGRQQTLIEIIELTVNAAVEGASSTNGACFPGQLEEMKHVIGLLHSQAALLGMLIARMERLPDEEGEMKAVMLIGDLIAERIDDDGSMPGLSDFFDANMN